MKTKSKKTIVALFVAGILTLALAAYCFRRANLITAQLWERANYDPTAALFLLDETDSEAMATAPRELVSLKDGRIRSLRVGRISMTLGLILLFTSLTLRIWKRE
jgi:hypothetical protein